MGGQRADVRPPWWRQVFRAATGKDPRSAIIELGGQTVALTVFLVLTPGLVALFGTDVDRWPIWWRVPLVAWTLAGLLPRTNNAEWALAPAASRRHN